MIPLLCLAAAAIGLPTVTEDTTTLPDQVIVSFVDDRESARWITVNDNVMGGRSEGGPTFADGILTFSGSTNTNGGGFSSIRTREQEWEFGDADGLLLRVRGDGREYIAALTSDVRMGRWDISYWTRFQTESEGGWTTVRLPFDAFIPTMFGEDVSGRVSELNPEDAQTIGFYIYDKKDGPFQLDVAWIGTYSDESIVLGEPATESIASEGETQLTAEMRAMGVIDLAIRRGVPRFNAGDVGACADIYEVALASVMLMGDDLDAGLRASIESGLREGAEAHSHRDRAWAYRGAMDEVLGRLMGEGTPQAAKQ